MRDTAKLPPEASAPGDTRQSGRLRAAAELPWHQKHLWQLQPVRDFSAAVLALILLYGGYLLAPVTVPLLVALGFAYLVEPLIVRIMNLVPWLPRRAVVITLLALIFSTVSFGIAVIVPVVAKQAQQLRNNSPAYIHSLRKLSEGRSIPEWSRQPIQTFLDSFSSSAEKAAAADPSASGIGEIRPSELDLPVSEARVREIIRDELTRQSGSGKTELSGYATHGLQALTLLAQLAGSTAQLIFFAAVAAICFLYLSSSFPQIKSYSMTLLPIANRELILGLFIKMDATISAFVRGRLLISLILTAIYMTGWTVLGIPYAVLLGVLTGLCSVIPYLAWSSVPAAWILLVVMLTGDSAHTGFYFATDGSEILWWKVVVLPALVILSAQITEDYLLTPTIQGQATNLHPLTITLAVISGGVLAGLYGMLLAIPTAACLKILIDEIFMPKLKAWLQGERRDPFPV